MARERVITNVFNHYAIPLEITDVIRGTFKAKLWRMGKRFSTLGGQQRSHQLSKWKEGSEANWTFTINETEVNCQSFLRKRKVEAQLHEESQKCKKLEKDIKVLNQTTEKQARIIAKLKSGQSDRTRRASKSWTQYSRQQKYNRKKQLASDIQGALSFCQEDGFKPCAIEVENIETGMHDVIDYSTGTFCSKENISPTMGKEDKVQSTLYVKDKYSISDSAFHELAMLSDLPKSNQVKKLAHEMSHQFNIYNAPSGIVGVQQSLKARITTRLAHLIEKGAKLGKQIPSCFRIKLTGDGTQIARGLSVVNFGFTILEEDNLALSVKGNHSVAILRVSESYDDLLQGLQDIIAEAKDIETITINDVAYQVQLFLGGDWKFLSVICGIESATSEYACIWCKCSKSERCDMKLKWSITDTEKGARTIEEITEKSKLSKKSKQRYNCCKKPAFPFIPLHQVIIDPLHMFLRISDVLINLLIRDLRVLDGIEKVQGLDRTKAKHLEHYEQFLQQSCKIHFKFYADKTTQGIKWRDLMGPEKIKLFSNIDIPTLFPALEKKVQLQKLWKTFFELIKYLNESECDHVEFDSRAKLWVDLFTSLYQSKDVTPYMHAFAMHVSQFMDLHGNITMFTQQGLEKLLYISKGPQIIETLRH